MRRLVLVLLLLASFPACAETETVSSRNEAFCHILLTHKPAADVEYRPGQDEGVAPADLYGSPVFTMPDKVVFPLTVDLAEHFGFSVPAGVELKPDLGSFEIRKDGTVLWNGRDMSAQAESYCGQQDGDVIKSQAPETKENEDLYGADPNDSDASPAKAGQTQNGH